MLAVHLIYYSLLFPLLYRTGSNLDLTSSTNRGGTESQRKYKETKESHSDRSRGKRIGLPREIRLYLQTPHGYHLVWNPPPPPPIPPIRFYTFVWTATAPLELAYHRYHQAFALRYLYFPTQLLLAAINTIMGKIVQKRYLGGSDLSKSISPPLRLYETISTGRAGSPSLSSVEGGNTSSSSSSNMARSSRFCQVGEAQQQRPRRAAGTWTTEEDKLLYDLVERFGDRAWVKVANDFQGSRDKKQCRERWYNHVDPNINNAPFSTEENIFIMDYYIRHGRQWAKMSRTEQLLGRPDNAIKNHFNTNLIGHFLDLCHEYEVDPRQISNSDGNTVASMLAAIKGKLSAPIISNGKGIKCSRFLTASPCLKIENLMAPNKPTTILQRRKRASLQHDTDRHIELSTSLPIPMSRSSNGSYSGGSNASWRGQPISESGSNDESLSSSLLLRPHHSLMRTPTTESTNIWPSPTIFATPQGRSPSLLSPSLHSDISLAEIEERVPLPTDRFTRWCNASGQFCLPPLSPKSVSPLLGATAALSIRPELSAIDEQQKALLASLEARTLHHRERSPRLDYQ